MLAPTLGPSAWAWDGLSQSVAGGRAVGGPGGAEC